MTSTDRKRKPGTPGAFSRWVQQRANARVKTKIRRGRDKLMGMDMLILHTVGRRSGQARETPLAWFADSENSWLIVASGGGSQNPDWFANAMVHPGSATIELAGRRDAVPVTPERLDGPERAEAWARIAEVNPRMAKYQRKSERQYPIVRLSAR